MESLHTAIILGGDFNPTSNGFQQKRLERHCNLNQIVMQPTRDTNTLLDLIFTDMVDCLPPPQALLIESSNRCGRKFRDAQAVLTLAGKARKRLLNNSVNMARKL